MQKKINKIPSSHSSNYKFIHTFLSKASISDLISCRRLAFLPSIPKHSSIVLKLRSLTAEQAVLLRTSDPRKSQKICYYLELMPLLPCSEPAPLPSVTYKTE